MELLSLSGMASIVPYGEIKRVHFVKDFDPLGKPPARNAFLTRPKLDGLWVRLLFKDGDALEGVLSSNLLQLEPPCLLFLQQRIFVLKSALADYSYNNWSKTEWAFDDLRDEFVPSGGRSPGLELRAWWGSPLLK